MSQPPIKRILYKTVQYMVHHPNFERVYIEWDHVKYDDLNAAKTTLQQCAEITKNRATGKPGKARLVKLETITTVEEEI